MNGLEFIIFKVTIIAIRLIKKTICLVRYWGIWQHGNLLIHIDQEIKLQFLRYHPYISHKTENKIDIQAPFSW